MSQPELAGEHYFRVGTDEGTFEGDLSDRTEELRSTIEPWLSAIFQSEHLSVVLGNGFTLGVGDPEDVDAVDMSLRSMEIGVYSGLVEV